jgi:leucyl aminopeptidase
MTPCLGTPPALCHPLQCLTSSPISTSKRHLSLLVTPCSASLVALAEAYFWCRALITTPAEDCGPQHMAAEAAALAAHHPGASLKTITGEELLAQGYPAVHTVGRAAAR